MLTVCLLGNHDHNMQISYKKISTLRIDGIALHSHVNKIMKAHWTINSS